MNLFDRPDLLTSGVGYRGPPETFSELARAAAENQRLNNSIGAHTRALEEEFETS